MNDHTPLENLSKPELIALLQKTQAALAAVPKPKKYGLVWEEKPIPEQVVTDCENLLPILEEGKVMHRNLNVLAPNPELDADPEAEPTHLLIEGDNYHALQVLQYTHYQKIDLIYIDPPYNTGSRDFKYNDRFVEKDDTYRHSKWLAFMHKRLALARNLLADTGCIFISIDDNEQAQLKLLCDEVFGADNFVGTIIWNKKNPKGDAKEIASMHEYIICYTRRKDLFLQLPNVLKKEKKNAVAILNKAKRLVAKIGKKEIPEELNELLKNYDLEKHEIARFEIKYDLAMATAEFQQWLRRQSFSEGEKAYKYLDEQGRVFRGVSMAWPNKEQAPDDYKIPLIHPITGGVCPIPARGWRNPSKTMQDLLDKKLILFGIDENTQPVRKYLLEENLFENTSSIMEYAGSDDMFFKDINIEFPYPKPVGVIQYLLKKIHPNPKIILDFFAGSGTTGHSILEMNRQDNTNIQFILVTNNEIDNKLRKKMEEDNKTTEEIQATGLCQAITYERLKRVISGYTTPKGKTVAGLGGKLRYYQTEFVENTLNRDQLRLDMTLRCTEMLCIKENIFTPLPKGSVAGKYDVYHETSRTPARCRTLAVYYAYPTEQAFDDLRELLAPLAGKKTLYFMPLDANTINAQDFEDWEGVEIEVVPDQILSIYKMEREKQAQHQHSFQNDNLQNDNLQNDNLQNPTNDDNNA